MAVNFQFIGALRRFGAESAANRQQILDWKTAALTSISNGESGQAVSVSANGVSAGWSQGLSNLEWFTALDQAVQYLDAGLTPSSRAVARII